MPTLTSKLEAVNSMLGHIGESPVNSISDTNALPISAATAISVLDEVSRSVQAEGWHHGQAAAGRVPLQVEPGDRSDAWQALCYKQRGDAQHWCGGKIQGKDCASNAWRPGDHRADEGKDPGAGR